MIMISIILILLLLITLTVSNNDNIDNIDSDNTTVDFLRDNAIFNLVYLFYYIFIISNAYYIDQQAREPNSI